MIVKDFPDYEITLCGKVINRKTKRQLEPIKHHSGYLDVRLYNEKGWKQKRVHRLLAEAYLLNPENLTQVNHKNGLRNDNRIVNLEWCSPRENTSHRFRNRGELNGLTFCKATNKWRVNIFFEGKSHSLGRFKTVEEAKEIRNQFLNNNGIANRYA